jgi:hypothetical protein
MATSSSQGGSGPVGTGEYEVQQGDCIASIADAHGLFWQTIWNDPQNADLKRVRKNPNILFPGDRVHIPEKDLKWQSRPTEQKHQFVRLGVPEKLEIVVKSADEARANEKYRLVIDGKEFTGQTDGNGRLKQSIPPGSKMGVLTVGEGAAEQAFEIKLGHMDPIDEISGLQGRLNNLGFDCGEENGELNDVTVAAMQAFQAKAGIPVTREPDQATRDALASEHGS